ncbi:MAG TPA: hypothetical protein DEV78_01630 [Clostridiales bacterium]|nr:hypothetical protein [Clostridiales bacterium]
MTNRTEFFIFLYKIKFASWTTFIFYFFHISSEIYCNYTYMTASCLANLSIFFRNFYVAFCTKN